MMSEHRPTLLPQLRLPEFRDAGEWEEKRLGEVCKVIAGQSPSGAHYNHRAEGIPFYQGKTGFGDIYLNKPTTWTTQVTKLADKGDILISVRAPVGALNIATEKVCIGRGLAAIKAKQDKWYLYYFLNYIQKSISGNGGSIFDSINKEQIEELKLSVPSPFEQEKIADCLSSLDGLIDAQSRKLDALREHKQGLMQQLFPAEGERMPKLRFPEFRDAGEWEEKRLGELFSNRIERGLSNLPLMSLTEQNGIIDQKESNRKDNSNPDKSKYLRICPGDVAYNTMRMWQGRCAYVKKEGLVSPSYTICKPKHFSNGLFFLYFFKTAQLIKKFHSNSQGLVSDTFNLKYKFFSNIKIPIPTLPEQQKIADCLSSLDGLIDAQNRKLDALREHKRGLMERLFPFIEEMKNGKKNRTENL